MQRKCKGPEAILNSKNGKRSVWPVSRGQMCRKARGVNMSTFAFAWCPDYRVEGAPRAVGALRSCCRQVGDVA